MTDPGDDAPLHPSFFDGRVLIEILSWEWSLYVGVSRTTPRKYRFQGGLDLVRTIDLDGRIQAPEQLRGRDVQVYVRPFGPEMRFSRHATVGSLQLFSSAPEPRACEASLLLPEADLAMLAIALSTTTKYLHIWTRGLDVDVAGITEYSLSSTIGRKVKPWAGVGE